MTEETYQKFSKWLEKMGDEMKWAMSVEDFEPDERLPDSDIHPESVYQGFIFGIDSMVDLLLERLEEDLVQDCYGQ